MAVGGFAHRVDLNLGRILVLEDFVEVDKDISSLRLCALSLEAKLLGEIECSLLAQAVLKVDGSGDDGRRVFCGDLLNVHTALCRGYQNGAANTTIVQDGDVVFVGSIPTLSKHDLRSK